MKTSIDTIREEFDKWLLELPTPVEFELFSEDPELSIFHAGYLAALSTIEGERIIWQASVERLQKLLAESTIDLDAIRRDCASFVEIKDWLIGKSSEYKSEYIQAAIVILREMFKERAAILATEPAREES